MDIVVTIPKNEYKNDELELRDMEEKNLEAFWTLSRQPQRLKKGDRIYFVKNKRIDSSMEVTKITIDSSLLCTTTGRTWSGRCQLMLSDYQDEKHLNINTKGFQGFRYRWWEKEGEKI